MNITAGTKIYTSRITIRDGKAAMTSSLLRGIEYLALYIGKVSAYEHPTEDQINTLLCHAGYFTKAQVRQHLGIKALMELELSIERENIKPLNQKPEGEPDAKHFNPSL